MAGYTITLTVNAEADDVKEAARIFVEFARDQHFVMEVEDHETGISHRIDTYDDLESEG